MADKNVGKPQITPHEPEHVNSCRDPEERVFYKGRWYEGLYLHVGASEEDKGQYAEFQKQVDFWVNWRDSQGKRAFVFIDDLIDGVLRVIEKGEHLGRL